MKRREFLKTSFAASALAGLSTAAAAEPKAAQEYYQLRVYRLKSGGDHDLLDSYLSKAAIPALNRLGSATVGAFTEIEPKEGQAAVYVLIPYSAFDSIPGTAARLRADPEYKSAAAEYLNTPPSKAAYERIDTWILRAFAGLPKLELPSYSKEKKDRILELRTYESYSESKALKKIDMFNDGEIDIMRDVGLGPIFFGQALAGANLPHLTYMLSAENRDEHKKHWEAFGKNPTWKKMSGDPQYKDTVSKIYNRFLKPAPYSQI